MGTDRVGTGRVDTDRVHRLDAPFDEATARSLRCGDEVWIDGTIWGVRDASLIRFFDEGERVPADGEGRRRDGPVGVARLRLRVHVDVREQREGEARPQRQQRGLRPGWPIVEKDTATAVTDNPIHLG